MMEEALVLVMVTRLVFFYGVLDVVELLAGGVDAVVECIVVLGCGRQS